MRKKTAAPPTTAPAENQPPTTEQPPEVREVHPAVHEAKRIIAQRVSLMKIALRAAESLRREFEVEFGRPMPTEQFQAITTTFFISAERKGIENVLPVNIRLSDLTTIHKITK